MAVIVLNHPSSGGLLPTPPPTCRLLHHSLLTPFNHRQSTTDETVTKSKWKGRSSSIPSRNRSPSTSPPRNSYKRHKTVVDSDEEKKERYSGAAFFSASPAPQSLPLPTFLFTNKKNDKEATSTAKGTATDVDNLGRRRQYPRDLLVSLSKSVPTCLPPQLQRSEIRDLDSRRW